MRLRWPRRRYIVHAVPELEGVATFRFWTKLGAENWATALVNASGHRQKWIAEER